MTEACPCGSGRTYAHCCGPLHAGASAPTAEALMRSRYSAFALRNAPYLAQTAVEPTSLSELQAWLPTVTWLGLTVVSSGPDEVEFIARSLEQDREVTLRERSRFVQQGGRWLYASGQPQVTTRRLARNEPCPCGSGRKFKSCHG